MIVGFLLATLTQVGAAEIGQSDYVEFRVHDLARTKTFYSAVFGWTFADFGPTYASFDDGKIGGGFTTDGTPAPGGPLMVFYVPDIEAAVRKVKAAGGTILKPPFAYPGGRRFHFSDPDGYEIAAWSQK
jgi:predicted enzyme related to lactoylglutathione lyase